MKVTLLTVMFLLSMRSIAQECEALKTSSVAKIIDYLQHAADDSTGAACVQVALHRMGALPQEQAIPLLTTYLGYKRPLSEGERHGFFMHGSAPDVLYPAIQALYSIGSPAEIGLVSFLARYKDNAGPASKNAVYTLLLIHHGDAVSVVQELHKASVSSTSDEARDRLQAAAGEASKWCDERARSTCEDALK
jgi:hypothetical protein